ncbi:MAG: DUF111 family protein, partial [Actinobacteria bacterium]|nr:DUF111 family protein [Actinomycetota bacterium]
VGYGAGSHRLDFPNVLRLIVGEEETSQPSHPEPHRGSDEVVLETNIDDLNPELFGYVLERLLQAGAQDAWLTPIVMKKGRPAVTLSVLCSPDRAEAMREIVFSETGTLGIRTRFVEKETLERETLKVETPFGPVGVKVGRRADRVVSVAPEFEECARIARESGVPAKDVFAEALRLAREALGL